jgi:hypothetical protein
MTRIPHLPVQRRVQTGDVLVEQFLSFRSNLPNVSFMNLEDSSIIAASNDMEHSLLEKSYKNTTCWFRDSKAHNLSVRSSAQIFCAKRPVIER